MSFSRASVIAGFFLTASLFLPNTICRRVYAQNSLAQTAIVHKPRGDSPSSRSQVRGTKIDAPNLVPIRDAGGQVFNIKAYGAKGDGLVDDTAAIQAAMDAAVAVAGMVYAPPGNYLITHPISAVIAARPVAARRAE